MITQQQKLLQELQKGAVNSYYATFVLGIKQAPVRILELKEKGYKISSSPLKANRSVDWTLENTPTTTPSEYVWDFSGGYGRRVLKGQQNIPEQGALL